MTKKSRKNREKLFLTQHCLNRIMSQISELSETNNEPTFGIHQKMTKIEKKNQKINFSGQNCLKIF